MKDFEFFHGAALIRIIHDNISDSIKKYTNNNSSYAINSETGIYIKYSQSRMSPWNFSFSDVHVNEIKDMKNNFGEVYIVLVCNHNGICCLNFEEFSAVISIENKNFPKWIKASRMKGEKYFISGSDGELKHKIGDSDFPKKIYD